MDNQEIISILEGIIKELKKGTEITLAQEAQICKLYCAIVDKDVGYESSRLVCRD